MEFGILILVVCDIGSGDAFLVDIAKLRRGDHGLGLVYSFDGINRRFVEAILVGRVVKSIGILYVHEVGICQSSHSSRGFGAEHGEVDPVVEHISGAFDHSGDLVIDSARMKFAGNNTLQAADKGSEGSVSVQTGREFTDSSLDLTKFEEAAQNDLDS